MAKFDHSHIQCYAAFFLCVCDESSIRVPEAKRENATDKEKAVGFSQLIKKAVKQHRIKQERREQESSKSINNTPQPLQGQFITSEVQCKDPIDVSSLSADYEQVKRKGELAHRSTCLDRDLVKPSEQLETSDYMTLIGTQEGVSSDYQSLKLRDELSTTESYYAVQDSMSSSSENDYQPLLLANMKETSSSRDSLYQTLFSYPDPQA